MSARCLIVGYAMGSNTAKCEHRRSFRTTVLNMMVILLQLFENGSNP